MTPGRAGRPLTRTTVVLQAAHVFFELAAGAGMPFASIAGPAPAAGTWAGTTGLLWRAAGRAGPDADSGCAVANVTALAAVAAHLTAWPSRRTGLRLPVLTDCEGMGPRLMPAYNALLYAGGLSALAALARENRGASRLVPLLLPPLTAVLGVVQRAEHRRLRAIAVRRPATWNRRLRPPAGPAASGTG